MEKENNRNYSFEYADEDENKCDVLLEEKKLEIKTLNIEFDYEVGTCCFCGEECNLASQSCGRCSHKINGWRLGWNDISPTIKNQFPKSVPTSAKVKKVRFVLPE